MNGNSAALTDSDSLATEIAIDKVIRSPIILTGRGGSGTRMLSSLAQSGNVFIGNQLNQSGDSIEWAELLYEISLQSLKAPASDRSACVESFGNALRAHAKDYLAAGKWQSTQLWGWKLPESMLVIPELTSIFDQAKVIHLVRHPITSSIRRTHKTSRNSTPIGRAVLNAAYKRAGRDLHSIDRDDDYLRNVLTWKYQVETVRDYAETNLSENRYWEVKYEDICKHPESVRKQLFNFLNLSGNKGSAANAIQIDTSRNNSSSFDDSRASEVWDLCADLADKLGYNSTGVANELG